MDVFCNSSLNSSRVINVVHSFVQSAFLFSNWMLHFSTHWNEYIANFSYSIEFFIFSSHLSYNHRHVHVTLQGSTNFSQHTHILNIFLTSFSSRLDFQIHRNTHYTPQCRFLRNNTSIRRFLFYKIFCNSSTKNMKVHSHTTTLSLPKIIHPLVLTFPSFNNLLYAVTHKINCRGSYSLSYSCRRKLHFLISLPFMYITFKHPCKRKRCDETKTKTKQKDTTTTTIVKWKKKFNFTYIPLIPSRKKN